MYKKAVSQKLRGGILAELLCGVFLAALIALTDGAAMYLLAGFIGIFLIMIPVSMVKYITHLNAVKAQYGDELEADVNACEKNVAGKYFFFDDCLIDLAEARMIYYSEITRISGMHTEETWTPATGRHYAGAVIQLTMDSGNNCLFSSFTNGMAKNSTETINSYRQFCLYMGEYAPHAIAEGRQ